jgi:hypothetical protein
MVKIVLLLLILAASAASAHRLPLPREQNLVNRRTWFQRALSGAFGGGTPFSFPAVPPPASAAAAGAAVRSDLLSIQETLQRLLDNWQRAVADCVYADVPRELLDAKNKDLLLEKASTYALFDKSVSVTSCKTVNTVVRDYLGLTGIGPVAGLDRTIKQTLEYALESDLDTNAVEAIVQTTEDLQRARSRADSYSYSARRDSTSVNNFAPEEAGTILADADSNLARCRAEVATMVSDLSTLIKLLPTE